MLRNREFVLYIVIISFLGLAATLFAAFFAGKIAALIVFFTGFLLIIVSFVFTWWRYKEIEKLSSYLRRISAGDFSLDVRENNEGELSILKNEIYKVTKMLSENSTLLQEEKSSLTDAISDISHQLKTPLTSMMMMADFLGNDSLPVEKRREFTGKILSQLERMDWLVSSLLKLSKIDAGTVRFKKERILVKDVIERALEPVLIPMEIKEQQVKLNGDKNVSFIGDINWSTEALVNILKNCVEHTGIGGTIHISFSENPLFTEIIITDNGKGISKEDLRYIFKRFYKGKNAADDSIGIGLAMAHSIITSQKGDISVNSEEGKGTEFVIKFYKQVV